MSQTRPAFREPKRGKGSRAGKPNSKIISDYEIREWMRASLGRDV